MSGLRSCLKQVLLLKRLNMSSFCHKIKDLALLFGVYKIKVLLSFLVL